MRRVITLFLPVIVWAFLSQAQTGNPPRSIGLTKVVIRVLDGKSGKPVKNLDINVYLDHSKSPMFPFPRTDSKGETVVDLAGIEPPQLALFPADLVDCRFDRLWPTAGPETPFGVFYSLAEIGSKGVVAENSCSSKRAIPTPGVLVIYVRKLTSKEKRDL